MFHRVLPLLLLSVVASCASSSTSGQPFDRAADEAELQAILERNPDIREQLGVPAPETRRVLAKDAMRQSDIQALSTAIMLFAIDHGHKLPAVRDGAVMQQLIEGKYLTKPMSPPDEGERYCYSYTHERDQFVLSTWLEESGRVHAVGDYDRLRDRLARLNRRSFFDQSSCPVDDGWVSVALP